jgi:hypothetical protein
MRGASLAAALVSVVPALAVLSTFLGSRHAVAVLAERTQQALRLHLGAGAYAICAAALPMLVAALRLGRQR